MLLTKRMDAWEFLCEINENDNIHREIGGLYEDILDHNLCNALDNVITDEFPNGVDEDELISFFMSEEELIREKLGIIEN